MMSMVQTPCTGRPSASPSARAVTSPARSPVYGPGPVPTAIPVRSPAAAPAVAITRAMAGASSSPCRRASTASSAVTTAVPSCSATVTAGVAVSKASSSTVEQRRSPGEVAGPAWAGWPGETPRTGGFPVVGYPVPSCRVSAAVGQCGEGLPGGGERPGLQLAQPDRPVAAGRRALLTLEGHRDQHVAVPDHQRDQVVDGAGPAD